MKDAEKRYEAHIKRIVNKAQDEIKKANEIAFIMMLEKQSAKMTIDDKIKTTRKRREEIE